jgi:hypothetical protein
MRQRFQESLGETSGAVEIEVEQLDRFERGSELPTEDILMLLISHFNLQDDEAVELWELAGYDGEFGFGNAQQSDSNDQRSNQSNAAGIIEDAQRHGVPVMVLALDNRILYSNGVDLTADDAGMVLNFMQTSETNQGTNQQRYPVSRIGMSFEQAEQLAIIIQKALLHKKYRSGPKQLPPPQGD